MTDCRHPVVETDYSDQLLECNELRKAGFRRWAFHPGMLFGAREKWWGDRGPRPTPHEGIDLCLYTNERGHLLELDPSIRIPVMFDGVVRAVFTDYLGRAIVVEHDIFVDGSPAQSRLLTVYAHTDPLKSVKPGARLNQGEVIANIAGTHRSKANILPHLHLSVAMAAPDLSFDAFVWNIMRDPGRITLLNPLYVLSMHAEQG